MLWLKTVVVLCFCAIKAQAANETHYIGAVVEYSPTIGNITDNVLRFVELIQQAKEQEADIIVFPEIGLSGYGECMEDMLLKIPHPLAKIAPCENSSYSKPLQRLSCAAKDNDIYVVVNVAEISPCSGEDCPTTGKHRYNTNVVFDRKGTVIARYRKYNLFNEDGTDVTADPELVFFDTDFGVRFGTFICFDALFEKPSLQLVKQLGIRDIVYSTAWFSELPFLTAAQTQQMWSYATDVNFLASGYNDPSVGSAGSGIYRGRNGPLEMTFPDNGSSLVLVAALPKASFEESYIIPKIPKFPIKPEIYLINENLEAYQSVVLDTPNFYIELCDGDFCCRFNGSFTGENLLQDTHQALVFNGVRTFGGAATGGIQACAIVQCSNSSVTSCGDRLYTERTFHSIEISGTFNAKSALQMPSTLKNSDQLIPFHPSEFTFESQCSEANCSITMEAKNDLTQLMTFGIYGRDFAKDGLPVTVVPSSTATIIANLALTAISFLVLVNLHK